MNSATKNVLTKWIIGIVIGVAISLLTGAGGAAWLGLCWAGIGIVFCPSFATKIAHIVGALGSFGGTPMYITGWIIGLILGLFAGPIVGIYQLILAATSNTEE